MRNYAAVRKAATAQAEKKQNDHQEDGPAVVFEFELFVSGQDQDQAHGKGADPPLPHFYSPSAGCSSCLEIRVR